MKKFIVILAFAATLGCGEEKVVEFGSLQQRGGVYVVPETQKPYSGKFVETTRKNVVIKAGSLKNGKLHGEVTTYREDGSIDKVETFANDVLNGKWKKYENGKLKRVEYYKDGKRDGKVEIYDENEKLITVQRGSFSDQRDSKTYKTVKIGKQTWMAENLNYEAEGSKCYENDLGNCQKYGRLYNWQTAMKSCPSGWHLPNGDEWQKLVNIAGGDGTAATLKAASGWKESGMKGTDNGTDEFGFSALPGGYGDSDGSFDGVGYGGIWWSASENYSYSTYSRGMCYYSDGGKCWHRYLKSLLRSVRCLQD
jgi:uncharacterized protein (TIGR02145 family)